MNPSSFSKGFEQLTLLHNKLQMRCATVIPQLVSRSNCHGLELMQRAWRLLLLTALGQAQRAKHHGKVTVRRRTRTVPHVVVYVCVCVRVRSFVLPSQHLGAQTLQVHRLSERTRAYLDTMSGQLQAVHFERQRCALGHFGTCPQLFTHANQSWAAFHSPLR